MVSASGAAGSLYEDLPHRWHSAVDALLRPLVGSLPVGNFGRMSLGAMRNALALPGSGVTLVPEEGRCANSAHRNFRSWLQEACRVLGFRAPAEDEAAEAGASAGRAEDGAGAPRLICPELWVDDAWPPSMLAPRGDRPPLVWSSAAVLGGSAAGRGLVVLQAHLLQGLPPPQAKAAMGYELGKLAYARLPAPLPRAWRSRLSRMYVGSRAYDAFRGKRGLSLLGSTIGGLRGRPRSFGGLLDSPVAPVAEAVALGMLVRRAVPRTMAPLLFGGLLMGQHEVHDTVQSTVHAVQPLLSSRRHASPGLDKLLPWLQVAGEAALLEGAEVLLSARARALVVTLDRAAALAAGDARAAAAVLLRSQGLLPAGRAQELDQQLAAVVADAEQNKWAWRRDAVLLSSPEPCAGARVRELLSWADSAQGRRLIALAEMRRDEPSQLSLLSTWRGLGSDGSEGSAVRRLWLFSKPWVGGLLLTALLVLPLASPIDAVRWASICTLGLTVTGIALPLLGQSAAAAALPLLLGVGLAAALVGYAVLVSGIWWNHLLGGSRHWAQFSSKLTTQLMDQADITAGIAYLTREWADIARRSLSALDEELRGSWRTSLQNLASILGDLREELEAASSSPQRSSSAASREVLGAGLASAPLWTKVDFAVKQAAQVEADRLRLAAATSDPEALQDMMTHWMARGPVVRVVPCLADAPEGKSLSELHLSQQLHSCLGYPSFHDGAELRHTADEGDLGAEDFGRLEGALAENFQSLQDLRRRSLPHAAETTLFCSWADALSVFRRFRQALQLPAEVRCTGKHPTGAEEDSTDRLEEVRMVSCLFLAACAGAAGVVVAALQRRWGWMAGSAAFGEANAVLLLNYSRLFLPHVRRRLERRLRQLSEQRDGLQREVQDMQKVSRRAGVVHVRACIFMQSVNVIRNMNYLALCVKAEVQRAAAAAPRAAASAPARQQVALCGMQLLLALLPHSDPQWRRAALDGEDCRALGRALGAVGAETAQVMDRLEESQRRLFILFRMVHLSSALPCEVQGQLGSLRDRYLRPVLIERRVPMGGEPGEPGTGPSGCKALMDAAAGDAASGAWASSSSAPVPADASAQDGEDGLGDLSLSLAGGGRCARGAAGPVSLAVDAAPADEDGLSWCDASSQSSRSLCSRRGPGDDAGKALRKLVATRGDVIRVLERLPRRALEAGGADQRSESVLGDIFSCVVLVLPSSCSGSTRCAPEGGAEAAARPGRVIAFATGYRHGMHPYQLKGSLWTDVLLQAAVPAGKDAGGSWRGIANVEVPLTYLVEEEPAEGHAAGAFAALAAASPQRFGDAALLSRRRTLKRAKDTLRAGLQ